MLRQGFVSNSSSTSFVIALRKGYTWEHAIKDAGPFAAFAQALADYAGTMQSIQNIELAYAREDLTSAPHISEETVVKWVKEGEYDFVREACEDTVEDPQGWGFAYGDAILDKFFMDMVGNPVAVHPDKKLTEYAKGHGWSVVT